jgi:hypothetical protein
MSIFTGAAYKGPTFLQGPPAYLFGATLACASLIGLWLLRKESDETDTK